MANDILGDDGPDDELPTREQLDDILGSDEYRDWQAETAAQQAADEGRVARRYEDEHRERFGNDYSGDGEGEPW